MSESKLLFSIPYSCGEDNLPACRLGRRDSRSFSNTSVSSRGKGNNKERTWGSKRCDASRGKISSAPAGMASSTAIRSAEMRCEMKNWSQYCDQVVRERDFYASKLRTVRALCEAVLTAGRKSRNLGFDDPRYSTQADRILEQIVAITSVTKYDDESDV